jgi:DNA ligase-1
MTVDLEVIGLEEGKDKYEGMLGALICRGFDGNKEIFVNVGSGLTDEERIQYWSNKTQIIGKIAEIKCDAITQNQEGTYSLRFPRFVRLRGFLVGEKI